MKRASTTAWISLLIAAAIGCEGHDAPPPTPAPSSPITAAAGISSRPTASAAPATDDARAETLRAEARALTDALQSALKQELMKAMGAGGPGAAIAVCNEKAPEITAAVQGRKKGWAVGRTALKVRNPDNAPTEWQKRGLGDLAKRAEEAGADIASLEWHEVAGAQMHYMRAIPLGSVCATCHGAPAALPAVVKDKLAELYPGDQATGFHVGDLRGAFVVTIPL